MNSLNKYQIRNELKRYQKKIILKEILFVAYLSLLFLLVLFEVKYIKMNLSFLGLVYFLLLCVLFYKPIKKVIHEIQLLKLCIILLKFELDVSKNKKLPPEIFRIFKCKS